ncbi:MAG: hypothetical protein HKN30_07475 [Sulfitobacter sp.]|nr:hypothetical protein [Sulfitobacter sp.]
MVPMDLAQSRIDAMARMDLDDVADSERSGRYAFNTGCRLGALCKLFDRVGYLAAGEYHPTVAKWNCLGWLVHVGNPIVAMLASCPLIF